MIGIDTNILVRYFTNDDSVQTKKSAKIMESAAYKSDGLWISHIVLIETVWVLESRYKVRRQNLINILNLLFSVRHFILEDREAGMMALQDFVDSPKVNFADCLIGRSNALNGCDYTLSFDKAAIRDLPYFKQI